MTMKRRGSGILLHITSLPSPYGIGDLGHGARLFVDFLAAAGQRYWQFLPTGPCSRVFDNSPYMSLAAFAGNPLLIDPQWLVDQGWLTASELGGRPDLSEYTVEFDRVIPLKRDLLRRAFGRFHRRPPADFAEFCGNTPWLDNYALFMACRQEQGLSSWDRWPAPLARREPRALATAAKRLAREVDFHRFVQFCFYRQWQALRDYAAERDVLLIGDIPIYVSFDSVDVWAHQECYLLDEESRQPTHVAGVPPDYFSDTGQRWGNPLYRWQLADGSDNQALYDWWRLRFRHIFATVDIVRIDHFRGFEAFWQIPAEEETAVNGEWVKGPGRRFFEAMERETGTLPIIAEDLGLITEEVEELRQGLGFPGMKVLQFAFDSDADNAYLPHNYTDPNCVVYPGTHDNDTTVGWYFDASVPEASKARARRYANSDGSAIHWDLVRLALASVARLAILPMQDLLGFGGDCRMNRPSTSEGNWRWRLAGHYLNEENAGRLRDETAFYGRTG